MYQLEIKRKAQKQIDALSVKDQDRVLAAVHVLKDNPLAGKALSGNYLGFRSVRVWPYRIIYSVDHERITVTVVKVGHRRDVYQS